MCPWWPAVALPAGDTEDVRGKGGLAAMWSVVLQTLALPTRAHARTLPAVAQCPFDHAHQGLLRTHQMKLDDESLLEHIGLDAFVVLRLPVLGLRFCFYALMPWGCISMGTVLAPRTWGHNRFQTQEST